MRLSNKILLASLNRDKFDEFRALLAEYPEIELLPVEDFVRNPSGLKFAERHETYLENAMAKARLVNHAAHYPALADDSGLEVEALGGKPGVRSHRYATPKAGLNQDQANVQFLLSELRGKPQPWNAKFVATLTLIVEGIMVSATGTLEGTLIDTPRGEHGFGYDPIFVPKGSNKTLAEMTDAEKNAISHRALALRELMKQVKDLEVVLAKP